MYVVKIIFMLQIRFDWYNTILDSYVCIYNSKMYSYL